MEHRTKFIYPTLTKQKLREKLDAQGYTQIAQDVRWLDSMVNFLSTIIQKVEMRQSDDQQYVVLHSDILGKVYGKRKDGRNVYYKQMIDMLENIGVINVLPAITEKISKRFRILPQHTAPLVAESVSEKSFDEPKESLSPTAAKHLKELRRLNFDVAKANQVIQRLHLSKRLAITSWVHRWSKKICEVKEDDNGRIYSNITGINREFRCCVSLNGEDLYGVDVKQAHPFFFIFELEKLFKQNLKKNLHEVLSTEKYADAERYIQDVIDGKLLEKIAEQIAKNKKTIELSELKVGLLAEVFYQRIKKNMHKIVKAFSQLYPTVWKYILLSKRKDHSALAAKLMKTESRLMNKAVSILHRRYPGDFFIRLHDAIITTKNMQAKVENVVKEVSLDLIGVAPKLSLGKFNKEDGQIADHDLTFEELSAQFTSDQCEDLERFYDSLTKSIYRNEMDLVEYFRRKDAKEQAVINAENQMHWLKSACLMRL